jgi:hypothetical protein
MPKKLKMALAIAGYSSAIPSFHELLSQPACNPADDNGGEPTNFWVSHGSLP